MFNKPFIFWIRGMIVLGLIVSATLGLGIASQVAGTVILTAAGYEGYSTVQTAISIGVRGGIGAYICCLGCCAGLIIQGDFIMIVVLLPILMAPFFILSGVLTGVLGFYNMKLWHLADALISEGFGYSKASMAGAVGGVVVGVGLLLVLQVVALKLCNQLIQRPSP
ncbi:hypothetical protein BJ165DRAFT_1486996 [Panaeolus papilionaceus]|nr:hypothetical protein BJ165DRAFT_1486996 [Panaeolus papilionaceus]